MQRYLIFLAELKWSTCVRRSLHLSLFHLRKENSGILQNRIIKESEALSVLAKHATVRAQLSQNLPRYVLDDFPHSLEKVVEVDSSFLKSLLRKRNITLKLVRSYYNLILLLFCLS